MPAVKDIITHVEVQVASKSRICHHNRSKHRIMKGDKCLAVFGPDGARRNYCFVCASEILEKAKTKLLVLERTIQN